MGTVEKESLMTDQLSVLQSVWDQFPDEEYRKDQSHWRGVGRWGDDARWKRIGEMTIARVALLWQHLNNGVQLFPEGLRVLEWGPGGGSNLYAFRNIASIYFGVDVSQRNLDECSRMITAEGFGNFKQLKLTGDPETIIPLVDKPIDLFVSTAVFQHFPDKEYGRKVLKAVRAVSHRKTVVVVQIRFDNGNSKFAGNIPIEDYKERHLQANSYRIDEFWSLCTDCGFTPLFLNEINPASNYATFYLKAA